MKLFTQGRYAEAAPLAQSLTTRFPLYGFAWMVQSLALRQVGLTTEALASMQQAVAVSPTNLEALNNLGNIYQDMGRLEEAEESFRQALQIKPNFVEACSNLGNILKAMGRFEEAESSYRQALQIKPSFADGHYNLGIVLMAKGNMGEAESSFLRAIDLNPKDIDAHNNLGNLLDVMGRFDEAAARFRSALQIDPNFVDAHYNLGNIFRKTGRLEDAEICYQRALQINPDFVAAHSNLLLTHCYMGDRSSVAFFEKSRCFGDLVARYAHPFSDWGNAPDPRKCLRVGMISGDLRSHPVGYFLEGVISTLASNFAGKVELVAYPSHYQEDALTERIRACCHGWHPASGLSDESLARQIREDGIDVLIDLSGHTAYNRLPMFAWKPAPVQATWLGYLATTGVSTIDYLIADTWTLLESEEANFTEKVWRLPESYLCFTPPPGNVEVGPLPALSNGHITFGSFNNLTKMNDAVVALWARILIAVSGSRLYLKSPQLTDVSVQQSVAERFAVHGIDSRRLILQGHVSRADYLKPFQRVDIALDPFPYPGVTTSVENLWMGVPVLTLSGKSFLSRQGVGLLMNAGLPEWIADTHDDYVARAVSQASDLQGLTSLRGGLRQRVMDSPIFDAARFAKHFEAALRAMWQAWCMQQLEKSSEARELKTGYPKGLDGGFNLIQASVE